MLAEIFHVLQKELDEIQRRVRRELFVKGQDKMPFFASLPYLDWQIIPALVTGVGRIYNFCGERVITLAVIIQLIYLAGSVHVGVADEGWSPARDPDNVQWPVLLGDYLYSRFFVLACEAGVTEVIGPLAEVVCSSNEARLQCRRQNPSVDRLCSLVKADTAYLFGAACRLTGQLAAAPPGDLACLERFGFSFGMGYGLQKCRAGNASLGYFAAAAQALAPLPPGSARTLLAGLIDFFTSQCTGAALGAWEG